MFSDELNSANLECPFFAIVESGFLTTAGERGVFWMCFGKVLEKNCDGDHDDEAYSCGNVGLPSNTDHTTNRRPFLLSGIYCSVAIKAQHPA